MENEEKLKKAIDALIFYADPKSYHGISYSGDNSVGDFMADFCQSHGEGSYPHPMPGSKARRTLDEIMEF